MRDRGRSTWLLVIVAFAGSLGVASASASPLLDRQGRAAGTEAVDDQRSTAAVGRRAPGTMRMRLHSGKVITVWRICAIRKDISGKDRDAGAEADKLDPLKQVVIGRKRALDRFLEAHPEQALVPAAYARYQTVRRSYQLAVSRFNAQISRYNAAAKRHNDALYACEV